MIVAFLALLLQTMQISIVNSAPPSGPGTGTFSLVQTSNCAIGSGASTCSMTVSPALAAGNLDVFSCIPPNTNAPTPPFTKIASVNAGGTLVPAIGSGIGGGVIGGTVNQQSNAYILPSTSTGHASPIVVTFNQAATGAGGFCYLAELHPSANPNNVGLDTDSSFEPSAACTSCTNQNLTLSGTNDAIFQGFFGASNYISPTAVTSPYSTNAVFSGGGNGQGFSIAATPANGNGPSWTTTSVVPLLSSMSFGWNPTAFVPQMFVDMEAGTAGNAPTTATLASSSRGWQGCSWGAGTAVAMKYATAASMPLLNLSGRLADGSSFAAGLGSLGLQIVGTGVSQTDYVTCSLNTQNSSPNIVVVFKYNENFVATDTTDIDCGLIPGSGSVDFIAANCYGDTTTRYVALETGQGNGGHINFPGGTASGNCPCTIVLAYQAAVSGVAGTHSLSLYNSSGSLIGSSTHAGSTTTSWPVNFSFGQTRTGALTSTKFANWDSVSFSPNTTVPAF